MKVYIVAFIFIILLLVFFIVRKYWTSDESTPSIKPSTLIEIETIPNGAIKIDLARVHKDMQQLNQPAPAYVNNHTNYPKPPKWNAVQNGSWVDSPRTTYDIKNDVLTVNAYPNDIDAVTGHSDRRRNEVRFISPELCTHKGEYGVWKMDIRIDSWGNVKWPGFYHVIQVKRDPAWSATKENINKMPVFTLCIADGNLVVTSEAASDATDSRTIIGPVQTGKWIPVTFVIDSNVGTVTWFIGGKSGICSADMSVADQLYVKIGQYQRVPNPLTDVTSSSYRNVTYQPLKVAFKPGA